MVIEELNSEIVSLSRQVGDLVTLLRERANRLPSRQLPSSPAVTAAAAASYSSSFSSAYQLPQAAPQPPPDAFALLKKAQQTNVPLNFKGGDKFTIPDLILQSVIQNVNLSELAVGECNSKHEKQGEECALHCSVLHDVRAEDLPQEGGAERREHLCRHRRRGLPVLSTRR